MIFSFETRLELRDSFKTNTRLQGTVHVVSRVTSPINNDKIIQDNKVLFNLEKEINSTNLLPFPAE